MHACKEACLVEVVCRLIYEYDVCLMTGNVPGWPSIQQPLRQVPFEMAQCIYVGQFYWEYLVLDTYLDECMRSWVVRHMLIWASDISRAW